MQKWMCSNVMFSLISTQPIVTFCFTSFWISLYFYTITSLKLKRQCLQPQTCNSLVYFQRRRGCINTKQIVYTSLSKLINAQPHLSFISMGPQLAVSMRRHINNKETPTSSEHVIKLRVYCVTYSDYSTSQPKAILKACLFINSVHWRAYSPAGWTLKSQSPLIPTLARIRTSIKAKTRAKLSRDVGTHARSTAKLFNLLSRDKYVLCWPLQSQSDELSFGVSFFSFIYYLNTF